MALLIEGASYKEVERTLKLSAGTVKSHMVLIRAKLNAKNKTHAAVIYLRSRQDEQPQPDGPRYVCSGVTG